MNTRNYVEVLGRRWRSVLAVLVIFVAGSGVLSASATPSFSASASLFFSLQNGNTANDLAQGSTFTQNQMASYARLATTAAVLAPVVEDLDLPVDAGQLARQVRATTPNDTVVLEVTATAGSADRAAAIANSVSEHLTEAVDDLAPVNAQGEPTVRSTVVAPAGPPRFQSSPDTRFDLVVGGLLGLVLGVLLALLREALDTRLRGTADVRTLVDAPVLGGLPADPASAGTLVVDADPRAPQAELYRQLRTSVEFLRIGGRPLSVAVTSAMPGEGKSTVALNLALALSEVSDRVLLVDADMRRPTVATRLGLEGSVGLSTLLVGRATIDDVIQPWGARQLSVLAAGAVPPNPAELLSSPGMAALAAELTARYDVVIWDSAPVLPVTDAQLLSRHVDGLVLIGAAGKVRRAQLTAAVESLRQVDATLLGVVVNMLSPRERAANAGYGAYCVDRAGRGRLQRLTGLRRLPSGLRRRRGAGSTSPAPTVGDEVPVAPAARAGSSAGRSPRAATQVG